MCVFFCFHNQTTVNTQYHYITSLDVQCRLLKIYHYRQSMDNDKIVEWITVHQYIISKYSSLSLIIEPMLCIINRMQIVIQQVPNPTRICRFHLTWPTQHNNKMLRQTESIINLQYHVKGQELKHCFWASVVKDSHLQSWPFRRLQIHVVLRTIWFHGFIKCFGPQVSECRTQTIRMSTSLQAPSSSTIEKVEPCWLWLSHRLLVMIFKLLFNVQWFNTFGNGNCVYTLMQHSYIPSNRSLWMYFHLI